MTKAKLSRDGEKVLSILTEEYGMDRENALKLMVDTGAILALTLLSRRTK